MVKLWSMSQLSHYHPSSNSMFLHVWNLYLWEGKLMFVDDTMRGCSLGEATPELAAAWWVLQKMAWLWYKSRFYCIICGRSGYTNAHLCINMDRFDLCVSTDWIDSKILGDLILVISLSIPNFHKLGLMQSTKQAFVPRSSCAYVLEPTVGWSIQQVVQHLVVILMQIRFLESSHRHFNTASSDIISLCHQHDASFSLVVHECVPRNVCTRGGRSMYTMVSCESLFVVHIFGSSMLWYQRRDT